MHAIPVWFWVMLSTIPTFLGSIAIIMPVVARVGGWSRLAESYQAVVPVQGRRWKFRSIGMRYGMDYNGCIEFAVDSFGLEVGVFALFRIGHATLFIPWGDISLATHPKSNSRIGLVPTKQPDVVLWISSRLAEQLREAAGAAWPQKSAG